MTEKPVIVLPEPDSPTRPTISPADTLRSTPSTAFTTPPWVKKWVRRPRTSSTGVACPVAPARDPPTQDASSPEDRPETVSGGIVRIEDIAQMVTDKVDADDGECQRDSR